MVLTAAGPVLLASLLGAVPDPATAAGPTTADREEESKGFHGSLLLENGVGRSTFDTDDVERRPLWNLFLSARPRWTLDPSIGLAVTARMDADVNLVESADSASTRPQQVRPGDLRLGVALDELAAIEAADLAWSAAATVYLPTSLLSRFTKKLLGLRADLSTTWSPRGWLDVSYDLAFAKNFHRYTNAVLDAGDFSIAPVSRAGGAEEVAEGLTAIGGASTSFYVDHALTLGASFLEKGSATLSLELFHTFTYQSFPEDDLTSPHADPGRGRSDTMYGTFEIGWELLPNLSVAAGCIVEDTPKTLDNERFRFPFWDTTSGSENRQVFYVDLIGSF